MKRPTIDCRKRAGDTPGMSAEDIHGRGAERHGYVWMRANQRAIAAVQEYLEPSDPIVREFLPLALLKVLNGLRVDAGEVWRDGKWVQS